MIQNRKATLLALLLLPTWIAYSQESTPPQKFKEWQFEQKEVNQLNLGSTCIASTQKTVGQDIWTFSVIASPTRKFPTSILLSSNTADLPIVLPLQTESQSTAQVFYRFEKLDGTAPGSTFLYAPKSLPMFYTQIRKDSSLKITVKIGGKVQKISLSLSGSMAALDQISKTCAGGKDFVLGDIYKYIENLKIDPTVLPDARGVDALWDSMSLAWNKYIESGSVSASLKSVQARIDPLIKQQQEFLRNNGLLTADIKKKTDQKVAIEDNVRKVQATLTETQNAIPNVENELASSKEILRQKEEIFRPVAEEGKPFFDAKEQADDRLDSINNRIDASEREISMLEQKIASLQSKLRSIQSDINTEESRVASLRLNRNQAQSDLNRFNYDFEMRQRLQSDSSYNRIAQDLDHTQNDIRKIRDDLRDKSHLKQELEKDLRRCQQNSGADCSQISSNLSSAESAVRSLESALRYKQSDVESLHSSLERRRSEIENEVKKAQDALADRVNSYDNDILRQETLIRQYQNQQSQIRNIDIPEAQDRISSLNRVLLAAQAQRPDAERVLSVAQRELSSFLIRSNYETKKNEFQSAQGEVSNLSRRLNDLYSRVQEQKTSLAKLQRDLLLVKNNLEALIIEASQSQEALRGIEEALAPLMSEKDRLATLLLLLQQDLKLNALRVKFLLKDLENTIPKQDKVSFGELGKFYDWVM